MKQFLLLLSIFATISTAATGQGALLECLFLPSDAVEAVLSELYDQDVQHSGLIRDDMASEIWVNRATGDWSLVLIRPDHTACLLATGQFWQTYGPRENPPNL